MFESDFERNLFALRQEKLKQIEALGQPAYPNSFSATHMLAQIRSRYDNATTEDLESSLANVSVAGRIMAIRAQGKAGFAQLQQNGERLQIYVRKDAVGDQAFELCHCILPTRSQTGPERQSPEPKVETERFRPDGAGLSCVWRITDSRHKSAIRHTHVSRPVRS